MSIAVTSYIPIPDHPRSAEEYEKLGEQLFATGIPLLRLSLGDLEHCWLHQYLRRHYAEGEYTHSVGDNPGKNTVAYHIVQAQKSEMLHRAAMFSPAEVVVWIDFGIFHLPGMTPQIVCDFMDRAQDEQSIAIPGCWGRDYEYDDRYPCWRFCGGVIVMPAKYAAAFNAVMQAEYKRHLRETGNLSWEINTLARVEQRYPDLPIRWYKADHDSSMFTNYQATEHADGRKAQGLRGVQG